MKRFMHSVAMLSALLWAWQAVAAPEDALKFLQNTGKTGVAQDAGLDAAKKSEVEGIANDLSAKTGAKVYFVLLKKDEDPEAYGTLYDRLNMSGKDVLVASNGTKWEVKVAALSHSAKQAAVDRALAGSADQKPIPRLRTVANELQTALAQAQTSRMSWNEFQSANAGKGWNSSRMSAEYQRYKDTGTVSGGGTAMVGTREVPLDRPQSSSHTGLWVFLAVAAAALVGWVVWRRRRRDGDLAAELAQNLQNPEAVLADVVMNMDGLENHPKFGQLMDAYTACENKLKALKSGSPTREAVSRARALNDEANRVRRMFDEAKMQR